MLAVSSFLHAVAVWERDFPMFVPVKNGPGDYLGSVTKEADFDVVSVDFRFELDLDLETLWDELPGVTCFLPFPLHTRRSIRCTQASSPFSHGASLHIRLSCELKCPCCKILLNARSLLPSSTYSTQAYLSGDHAGECCWASRRHTSTPLHEGLFGMTNDLCPRLAIE